MKLEDAHLISPARPGFPTEGPFNKILNLIPGLTKWEYVALELLKQQYNSIPANYEVAVKIAIDDAKIFLNKMAIAQAELIAANQNEGNAATAIIAGAKGQA
jgi:hypothetical protein